jgi:hypothetical protein
VPRVVDGSPETVDTALPTAAFEAVIVVEAVCWTVAMTLSEVRLVIAVTCETALLTGATAATRGVVAFEVAVGAGDDCVEALIAAVEVTGAAEGATTSGASASVCISPDETLGAVAVASLEVGLAAVGPVTVGPVLARPVRDEVVGELVAVDRTALALVATVLAIPDPSEALLLDAGLVLLASGFSAGAAEADAAMRSAIKNPSAQARSAKTA